jgi:UDP-N-acetylglucosamine transferase subunit ALG13
MTLWSTFCFATGLSVLGRGSRVLDPESLGRWRRDTVRRVDIVSGSLLLVDRTAWERLGGFDERFWLYGEDADLCRRAQALGYAPVITPDATITHALGASSPSIEDLTVRLFRGKRTLISTHWRPYLRPLGAPLLLFGVALRAAMPVRSARRWRAAWSRRSEWRHGYPDANDAARTSRRATGRRTVWMTSSGGGHAELLAQLLPAVRQFDRTWVMPDVHRSQWLREKGEHVLLVPDWYRDRSHRSLLHATLHSVWLAVRHRPRIVVTSGPGLVVPFCLTARALGAKLIFIETPARLSEPSKAGALLGRFSSAVLVQWKSMAQVYPHVIVCAPPMVAHVATEEEPPGLGTFVGVGTHQQGFDRLLAMVDDAVGRGVLPAPVVAQAGHSTYKPRNFQTRSWLRPDAIDKSIRDARYVVCHGGSGLITSAVRVGRRPLVLARQAAHGEHIDDHQVLMVEHLAAQDLVVALSTSISEDDTASAERPLLAAGADEPQLPTVGDAVAHELERLWPSAMGARA